VLGFFPDSVLILNGRLNEGSSSLATSCPGVGERRQLLRELSEVEDDVVYQNLLMTKLLKFTKIIRWNKHKKAFVYKEADY
jgi:hypothetical protein